MAAFSQVFEWGNVTAVFAAAIMLAAILLATELIVRRLGLGSFPLFEPAEKCIYRMQANKSGQFMKRYAWHYDANGMRNDSVPADFAATSLLVGDSIVDGGLRVGQEQTFASELSRCTGERHYTVACHGWGLANSMAALQAIPGWNRAKRLVMILNSGDFDVVQRMSHEFFFPTRHPIWLSLWLARRQAARHSQFVRRIVLRNEPAYDDPPPAELRARNLARFRELLSEFSGSATIVKYPARGEERDAETYFDELAALDPHVQLIDASEAPGWSDACYIDHIHPNAHGVAILARYVAERLS